MHRLLGNGSDVGEQRNGRTRVRAIESTPEKDEREGGRCVRNARRAGDQGGSSCAGNGTGGSEGTRALMPWNTVY